MTGFTLGVLFVLVIWGLSNHLTNNILIKKADTKGVEFIKGKPVVLVHERDYVPMSLKSEVYDRENKKTT
ncbi:hypothetical protein [Aquibacillus saliphilus]|uniref:hypothetical protein n=1 Tax=Aquibacillus saliphilus TaxID=1909422 RepID=UPI001CF024F1|nr:hypothetical protein [Aquibacillus saliphilus]